MINHTEVSIIEVETFLFFFLTINCFYTLTNQTDSIKQQFFVKNDLELVRSLILCPLEQPKLLLLTSKGWKRIRTLMSYLNLQVALLSEGLFSCWGQGHRRWSRDSAHLDPFLTDSTWAASAFSAWRETRNINIYLRILYMNQPKTKTILCCKFLSANSLKSSIRSSEVRVCDFIFKEHSYFFICCVIFNPPRSVNWIYKQTLYR